MRGRLRSRTRTSGVDVAAQDLLQDMAGVVDRHSIEPITYSALPGVVLVRADRGQEPRSELFVPAVCLVVQGAKTVQAGGRSHVFTPGTFVVNVLELAITGHVREVPYRAVALVLRPRVLAELLEVAPPSSRREARDFMTGRATPEVLDAMHRLVGLLDNPDDQAVLGSAAERELLYRVLQTDAGHALRRVALEGHLTSAVEPAIRWIREHLLEPLDIDELAEMTHLSRSSLFRRFRAATGSTPLQFQKRLRLQEARKLLLVGETSAAGAAARVGYQNPAHFSREYSRHFGRTPGRERAERT